MSIPNLIPTSPKWSSTTKLVVGLTFVAIVAALLVRFNNIIGPLILAFIISYLFHPLASFISERTRLSWRASVSLIYISVLILIIAFLTVTGVAAVQQLQSLVTVVQNFVTDLPELAQQLTSEETVIVIPGLNYSLNVSEFIAQFNIDVLSLSQQVLSVLQPALGQAGGLLGQAAASALVTLGLAAFVFIISYFILADAGRVPDFFRDVELPGLTEDLQRLGRELNRIWNAFLRGQLILFILVIISSFVLMSILGVRNAFGLAFLTGLAKFVPYVGPFIAGVTTALVAFFQGGNYLNIPPFTYALIVVVAAIVLDQVFDNLVTPRIFGRTLGVHPAAVLVSAIIAANLIGLVGLLLAAPVLASLTLFSRYTIRKMLDLNPWPKPEVEPEQIRWPLETPIRRIWAWLLNLFKRGKKNG